MRVGGCVRVGAWVRARIGVRVRAYVWAWTRERAGARACGRGGAITDIRYCVGVVLVCVCVRRQAGGCVRGCA